MGKLGIEAACLEGNVAHPFVVGMMVDCPHQGKIPYNHDDDDPYIVGQGEHQSPEIVLIDDVVLIGELIDGEKPLKERGDILSIFTTDVLNRNHAVFCHWVESDGE